MATNPVNLVDAVATIVPRLARNRSAVIRMGVTKAAASSGLMTVTVSGVDIPVSYGAWHVPYVGDIVALINDGDKWLCLGKVADATVDPQGTLRYRNGVIVSGDMTSTANQGFQIHRNCAGIQCRSFYQYYSGGQRGMLISNIENEVVVSQLLVETNGELSIYSNQGGTNIPRPSPFAMWTKAISINYNNTASGSTAASFTSSRFTDVPMVNANTLTSSGTAFTFVSAVSSTATTVGARIYDNAASAVVRDVYTLATQMYATTSEGLAKSTVQNRKPRQRAPYELDEGQLPPDMVETYCRTPGCYNEEHPVELFIFDHTTAAICGECDQPFDEAAPFVARNLSRR